MEKGGIVLENAEKLLQMEEGSAYTRKKRRVSKVFLVVTVLVLLIGGGCFGVFYYNINKVELDKNGKIDIYSLWGAKKVLDASDLSSELRYVRNNNVITSSVEKGEPYPKEEYITMLKREIENSREAVVYGTVKNFKIVTLNDHVQCSRMVWEHYDDGSSIQKERKYDYPAVWWIATFDIDVIDDMGTLEGNDSIRVVMASRYATEDTGGDVEYKLNSPERLKEILMKIQENPVGVFRLKKFVVGEEIRLDDTGVSSNGNIWKIKGKEYWATEFADFYLGAWFECDGEKFRYASAEYCTIYMDEIRVQEE